MNRELHLIAHDIRSRHNVGALFRLADSLGVTRLWLTGYTVAPPDEKLAKVALGAETSVPFTHEIAVDQVFAHFETEKIPIFALELTPSAVSLQDFQPPARLAILLGSERTGVSASLLERCAGSIQIEQQGKKESMNVVMAAAIASWTVLNRK